MRWMRWKLDHQLSAQALRDFLQVDSRGRCLQGQQVRPFKTQNGLFHPVNAL